ncbi:MAG: 4'-phosphopantetheinyl transferase superfamily protein, partial [Propionibacteriaceae bacterium]|nr:4'-phosphopantetheinyl transferase superfamily protein [Propionibacteriaceae bacterium]
MANDQDCGLRAILPAAVAVVETRVDVSEDALWPEERRGLEGVPTPRRLQYATVRHCARQGLALLGLPPSAIPSRPGKAPIWPEGVIGSMTHCHGYRAAVVARAGPLRTIGIDAEPAQALPAKVLARIALPAELVAVTELAATDPTTAFDRVLFCAKEAVFKAWYPLT